ncbi:TonB-dependent receptor [Dechloromonas denitrificans]|uniref:TonB-dependent receptor n=1 Tax=Dechloromonas denitrificans TaxID=281362 RepID=A0A133XEW0_9RHOO|nr:TonB-dependent receptor [Dechloromonas denitrificans]KXB29500.1 TonB-dependent receptor [Dechloromonas denitrificans]
MVRGKFAGGFKPLHIGVLLALAVMGQTSSAADQRVEESAVTLGEVSVRAAGSGALASKSVLSSVNILGSDMIANQNVGGVWQLFSQMPGVMLTEFRQGTTAGKLSFRAFNGEGEINAVKLLVDGIPSNSNDGNMPYLDMLFPLEIEAIELVKGTNDPRYGLHNIAGNASIVTDIGGQYTKARAAYGSFNTREVQLAKGVDSGGLSQNYFLGYQATEGYREHADSEKYSLAGKWFYTPDDGATKVGAIARVYRHDAQEPGYMTLNESRTDPEGSAARNASDAGNRRMSQFSGHFDKQLNERLFWSSKAYVNNLYDQRWVRFSQAAGQQERVVDEKHYGFLSTLTYRPVVEGLYGLAIEGGVDAQWQDNFSQRYNTTDRRHTKTTRDQQFDFDIYGAYVQAIIRPTENFKIVPALRVDRAYGNYTNLLNGQNYQVNDYGLIPQPKLSAMYTLTPGVGLYGNVGRSFQVGVGSAAYKVGQSSDLEPSLNDGWEVGVKLKPTGWLDGRLAFWQQTASNEARRKLNDPANSSENIGRTRRQGIDVETSIRPTDKGTLWLSYSYQNSEILKPESSAPSTLGKQIDHIPHHIFAAGVDYQVLPALRLSAWANVQSDYYLERANSKGKYGDFALLNVSASYQVSKDVALEFQVKNLTNQYYEYVWWDSDNNQSLHSPGDGRAFYGAVRATY